MSKRDRIVYALGLWLLSAVCYFFLGRPIGMTLAGHVAGALGWGFALAVIGGVVFWFMARKAEPPAWFLLAYAALFGAAVVALILTRDRMA